MKVKSSIKKICGFCRIIRRGKHLYVRYAIFITHNNNNNYNKIIMMISRERKKIEKLILLKFYYFIPKNFRCEKYNRHKQRQGFSTLDINIRLDKEKYCECEGEKQIDLTQEEESLYNIVEEECECCNVKSTDSSMDEFKK